MAHKTEELWTGQMQVKEVFLHCYYNTKMSRPAVPSTNYSVTGTPFLLLPWCCSLVVSHVNDCQQKLTAQMLLTGGDPYFCTEGERCSPLADIENPIISSILPYFTYFQFAYQRFYMWMIADKRSLLNCCWLWGIHISVLKEGSYMTILCSLMYIEQCNYIRGFA